MKYTIGKTYRFAAGHSLYEEAWSVEQNQKVFGKCTAVHGHNYEFTVEVGGDLHDGMVVNYYDLDRICEPIADYFDHCVGTLNALPEFKGEYTTAENIAYVIYEKVNEALSVEYGPDTWLESVIVKETEKTFAKVS